MTRSTAHAIPALMLLAAFAGCQTVSDVTAPEYRPEQAEFESAVADGLQSSWVFQCDTLAPVTAHFYEDQLRLDLTTQQMDLPQVPAASGVRFSDGQTSFHSRGSAATLTGPGVAAQCSGQAFTSVQSGARLRGAALRAVGQEPGWLLEVVPARWMHYRGSYGAENILTPVPPPRSLDNGVAWQSQAGEHSLRLEVRDQYCEDIMSGEPYPLTAVLYVNDDRLQGCAELLDQP